jgi:hypothetical protein
VRLAALVPAKVKRIRRALQRARATLTAPPLRREGGSFNIIDVAAFAAAMDSASYYQEHMLTAPSFDSDFDLRAFAAQLASKTGLVIEAGVATGRTINHLADLFPDRSVYGFDSFEGLPENWRTDHPAGKFRGGLPETKSNVKLIKGAFAETLPVFIEQQDSAVAFLHVDCVLYSSTSTVLRTLGERITKGTVIVFDEYWNYPGWRQHEFRAFQEFVAERGVSYSYKAFVAQGQQVCVQIDSEARSL